jgi:hypothetical protein
VRDARQCFQLTNLHFTAATGYNPHETMGEKLMIKGSCLCGTVHYMLDGFILGAHACHCRNCKKYYGTAHSSMILGLGRNLTWTQGREAIKRIEEDTPSPRSFCRHCGSPLPDTPTNGMTGIPAGTVDGDSRFRIRYHCWMSHQADWETDVVGPQYPELKPPDEHIADWLEIGTRLTPETHDDIVEFMRICNATEGFAKWWNKHDGEFDAKLCAAMESARTGNASSAPQRI